MDLLFKVVWKSLKKLIDYNFNCSVLLFKPIFFMARIIGPICFYYSRRKKQFLEWARVLGLIGKLKTKKKEVVVEKKAGPTTTRLSSWQ